MKLSFLGLKGQVGTVLAGAKLLGDVEASPPTPRMRTGVAPCSSGCSRCKGISATNSTWP